ncbi:MAG: 2-thiouracil desulfurase family protein [Candidatus Aenigmatarchaeota archaeon]
MDRKIIFVPHCILNQNVRAIGKEKANGAIKEIVNFLVEAEVGIVQLPCPEIEFDGGLRRQFKAKENYKENHRNQCKEISLKILNTIKKYLENEYKVLGILGIELSPTCGVYRIENGKKIVPGKGIFIEELEKEMQKKNFQVPIIGVNLNNAYSAIEKLGLLLKNY